MTERASKKQLELLQFIDGFIKGNGYGPSYREVMRSLGYKSVSTVAVHVDGLIRAGYLRKRDRSARSLEVVSLGEQEAKRVDDGKHQDWLRRVVMERTKTLARVDRERVAAAFELIDEADIASHIREASA